MMNLITKIEEKVSPKYLIYLKKNDYELYKNNDKEKSSISTSHIDNKIFEVIDIFKNENETLYLIGTDGNELCWVEVGNPILILNSVPERVSFIEIENDNLLNQSLGIESKITNDVLYTSRYVCNFNQELYIGIENAEEFIGFYPIDIIDFGDVEEMSFSFHNTMVNVYRSADLLESQMIITEGQEYVTEKLYPLIGLGKVRIGKEKFWFKANETDITQSEIKRVTKDFDDYYLEHLIQSIRIDKTLKVQGQKAHSSVNKEYVSSLNERMHELKKKNEEHLETNRKTSYELREMKLESQRKDSKLDYLNRLTENQKKKLEYYEERNKKLEARVELLEGKLGHINEQYKKLKESPLNQIQTKFLRK